VALPASRLARNDKALARCFSDTGVMKRDSVMKSIILNASILLAGFVVLLLLIASPSQAAKGDSFNLLCIGEDNSETYIESLTVEDHEFSDSDDPSGFSRTVWWYDTSIIVAFESFKDGNKFREKYIKINRLDMSFRLNDQLVSVERVTSVRETTGVCEIAPNRKI